MDMNKKLEDILEKSGYKGVTIPKDIWEKKIEFSGNIHSTEKIDGDNPNYLTKEQFMALCEKNGCILPKEEWDKLPDEKDKLMINIRNNIGKYEDLLEIPHTKTKGFTLNELNDKLRHVMKSYDNLLELRKKYPLKTEN